MGCLCSKGVHTNHRGSKRVVENELDGSVKQFGAPSSVREKKPVQENNCGLDATVHLISKHPLEENGGSSLALWNDSEIVEVVKKPSRRQSLKVEAVNGTIGVDVSKRQPQLPSIVSFSHEVQGAQVAAGWPSWLSAVAGEAIKGWLPRKADSFEKLDKIGQGTYSSVYRGRDLETGKLVAMKKVRFVNMDPDSVRFMAREILVFRRLDHPNVMKLEGLITSKMSSSLYLIFEYMDHDLAGLGATPGIKFTEPQIKCYIQQLLRGLEYCHSRGVLHRDIKGSNLLLDNNGNLKIGDFGLATFFRASQRQPLTSRVVTLWYRPPELLLGATDYGVGVDLWSAGCILAELFYRKPIMPGRTEVEQLHKIFKLCGSPSEEYWRKSKLPHATIFKPQNPYPGCIAETFKDFPSSALSLLEVLIAVEPESRGTASSALKSAFFSSNPLPCSPSSLPKYSPSKEFDAKLRNEARRKKATVFKELDNEVSRTVSKESKVIPASDVNSDLLLQKPPNPKIREGGECFEASRGATSQTSTSQCGQSPVRGEPDNVALMGGRGTSDYAMEDRRSFKLSRFSNSVVGGARNTANSHWGHSSSSLVAGYNQLEGADGSSHKWFRHRPKKESTMGYGSKNNGIHYSGLLIPPGGNLEEMLKEHERRIQNAVRKARLVTTKINSNAHNR